MTIENVCICCWCCRPSATEDFADIGGARFDPLFTVMFETACSILPVHRPGRSGWYQANVVCALFDLYIKHSEDMTEQKSTAKWAGLGRSAGGGAGALQTSQQPERNLMLPFPLANKIQDPLSAENFGCGIHFLSWWSKFHRKNATKGIGASGHLGQFVWSKFDGKSKVDTRPFAEKVVEMMGHIDRTVAFYTRIVSGDCDMSRNTAELKKLSFVGNVCHITFGKEDGYAPVDPKEIVFNRRVGGVGGGGEEEEESEEETLKGGREAESGVGKRSGLGKKQQTRNTSSASESGSASSSAESEAESPSHKQKSAEQLQHDEESDDAESDHKDEGAAVQAKRQGSGEQLKGQSGAETTKGKMSAAKYVQKNASCLSVFRSVELVQKMFVPRCCFCHENWHGFSICFLVSALQFHFSSVC